MNHRLVIALPLAAVLAIPALAQTTSSDQSQPAATQQSTSSDTGNATGKAPLAAPSREGFWGRVNPFARKKYVQRQTEPIRDRVNELDELTSQNSKQIKDVDSRATQGIKLASDKANQADEHAIDAGNKATAAQQSAQQVTARVQTVKREHNERLYLLKALDGINHLIARLILLDDPVDESVYLAPVLWTDVGGIFFEVFEMFVLF